MLKLAGRIALIVMVLLAGAILALALLAEPALRLALRLTGVETVRFEDLRLGLAEVELSGVELGLAGAAPGQGVERVRIAYRPADLLRGMLGPVEVEGLRLRGRLSKDGFSLAGLEHTEGEGGFALPVRPESLLLRDAEIALATSFGELILMLDDELHLTGPLSPDPSLLLKVAQGQGRFSLAAGNVEARDVGRGIELGGRAALDLGQGRLRVITEDLSMTVAALGPQLEPLGAALPAPWRISIGDAAPLAIEIEPLDQGWGMRLSGSVRLVASAGQLTADLATEIELDRQGSLTELSSGRAVLAADHLRAHGLALESAWVELTGRGEPGDLEGTLQLEIAGAGALAGGPRIEQASLRHDLAASFRDGRLELRARDAGSLALGGLHWPGGASVGPFALRLDPTEQPLLALQLGDGQPPAWTHQLAAAIEAPFSASLPGADPPLDLEVALPQLSIAATGAGSALQRAAVDLSGGRVAASEPPLEAAGIRASAMVEGDAGPRVSIDAGRLVSSAKPPWFAPMDLSGTLRPSDGRLEFEGRLARVGKNAEIRFQGSHDLTAGSGRVALHLPPVELVPGQLQPGDLIPAAAGLVENASGRLGADGDLSWTEPGGLRADLDLLLAGLSFTVGPARFQQVDGVVTLDGLQPPSTPPGQEIAIALLDVGLPLTGGLIDFQLHPDGALEIDQLRWRFAGGTVRAEPFRVRSGLGAFDVMLKAEHLSLDRLFALTDLDGLSGEGRISGELPVRIQGSDAIVRGGELTSEGRGTLRYRPASTPAALQAGGENVGLLLQALENFRYEELRITLDGRTDAEMDVGLHIKGANPALYDGHPIEFNLNLEGELGNILRRSLAGYQIPEHIRERIQGFPK